MAGQRPPTAVVQWAQPLDPNTVPKMMMDIFNKESILNPYLINADLEVLLQNHLAEHPAEDALKYSPYPLTLFCFAYSSLYC